MPYGNEPGGKNASGVSAPNTLRISRRSIRAGFGPAVRAGRKLRKISFTSRPIRAFRHWGDGLKSRINAKPPETTTDYRDYIQKRSVPVISHEIGQWCVYPNFDEIPKYTGYLKPKNFEIFRDQLAANGLGKLAKQFLLASGKLQTLCYKEDIESALAHAGHGRI